MHISLFLSFDSDTSIFAPFRKVFSATYSGKLCRCRALRHAAIGQCLRICGNHMPYLDSFSSYEFFPQSGTGELGLTSEYFILSLRGTLVIVKCTSKVENRPMPFYTI